MINASAENKEWKLKQYIFERISNIEKRINLTGSRYMATNSKKKEVIGFRAIDEVVIFKKTDYMETAQKIQKLQNAVLNLTLISDFIGIVSTEKIESYLLKDNAFYYYSFDELLNILERTMVT